MILIIDAYNVLKREMSQRDISEHAKHQFIQDLIAYNKKKRFTIYVVFDGGETKWSSKEWHNHVCVVHSGYQFDADAFIKNLIDEHVHHEMLLVTSDNELAHYAHQHQVPSIDSLLFYSVLRSFCSQKVPSKKMAGGLVKIADETTHDIDAIMIEGSSSVPYKQDDVPVKHIQSQKSSQAISKVEKKLIKLLEKLQD